MSDQEGPEKKNRILVQSQDWPVWSRGANQVSAKLAVRPQNALSNVYHTSFGVPVMTDSDVEFYYVQ